MNGKRRLIGSLNHGSMANALPQAIGAQAAYPGRQVISFSGDGGFAMLMGDLLTLNQHKLPVKIVVLNNGTLGFVEMEMKAAGFLETGVALVNPDFAAMASGAGNLAPCASRIRPTLPEAMRAMLAHDGPALLDVVTGPSGTVDAAEGRPRTGDGFRDVARQGGDRRARDRDRRPRQDQPLALSRRSRPDPARGCAAVASEPAMAARPAPRIDARPRRCR